MSHILLKTINGFNFEYINMTFVYIEIILFTNRFKQNIANKLIINVSITYHINTKITLKIKTRIFLQILKI